MMVGVRVRVILVLSKCIWNTSVVSLVLQAFDDTGSLGYSPCRVVYRPPVFTIVTAFRFLAENREAELKPTTFSSLSLFRVFLFLFSSSPNPAAV